MKGEEREVEKDIFVKMPKKEVKCVECGRSDWRLICVHMLSELDRLDKNYKTLFLENRFLKNDCAEHTVDNAKQIVALRAELDRLRDVLYEINRIAYNGAAPNIGMEWKLRHLDKVCKLSKEALEPKDNKKDQKC